MNRITIIYLLFMSSISFNVSAELSKDNVAETVAEVVANCYVAHQRGRTEEFTSGESDKMKKIISDLVGSGNVNKYINIAARVQGDGNLGNTLTSNMAISRYCSPLDELLIALSN